MKKDYPREAQLKSTAVVPIYFGSAQHGEPRQHRTGAESLRTGGPPPWAERGCGLKEKPAVPTRRSAGVSVSSHERQHDRFVLPPSAKHSCRICASNFGRSARRPRHGKSCNASHSSKSYASHSSVCGPGTAHRASSPGISSASPPERRSASPPLSSPPCGRGVGVPRVPNTYPLHSYHPPLVNVGKSE